MSNTAVITGGAGFIGCNAAARFLEKGWRVVIIDNCARKGARRNLAWLRAKNGGLVFLKEDVRRAAAMDRIFSKYADASLVLHLAGQVAVTTSVADPRADFETNALGAFNVLEAIRKACGLSPSRRGASPFLIYASTNKVYGGMEGVPVVERGGRYAYRDFKHGVPETMQLDFHSPYGCSKGTADQYVMDYHRIYGLQGVTLRQSCIYGCRQFGVEDQGWVAWFTIAAHLGKKITIYGDGKQVRDMLFIDDLLDIYEAAFKKGKAAAGKAYNIGGGPRNTMSLLELLGYLEKSLGKKIPLKFAKIRPGDQPVFISDIRKAKQDLGWQPKVPAKEGVERLSRWVSENLFLFK